MSNLVFDESSSNREALTWLCLVVLRGHVREGQGGGGAQAAQAQPNAQTHHTSRTSDHPVLHDVGRIVHAAPAHAHRHAERATTFTTAFFTAISAISTCGISIVNSTTHWSAFGQAVLIFSVQMGGLGVMTFASLIALAVNHHLKATQKAADGQRAGHHETRRDQGACFTVVIATAFTIEGITFVALFPGLYKVNHGNVRHTLWESLFFAVMAYNNAGFTPLTAPACMSTIGLLACLSSSARSAARSAFPSCLTSCAHGATIVRRSVGACIPSSR